MNFSLIPDGFRFNKLVHLSFAMMAIIEAKARSISVKMLNLDQYEAQRSR